MASSAATSSYSNTERSCLCGSVNAPSASPPQHASNTAKCKICRTKPKFCFLRGQRSFDLGQQGPSSAGLNGHVVSAPPNRSKEAEAIRDTSRAPLQGRRARSAERYEGLRVNGRTAPGLPRQTSLQTPVISNISAPSDRPPEYLYPELPPISSPPPPYEVAMRKMGHPPSYEEYLTQRLQQQQLGTNSSIPPPLPPRNPTMSSRSCSPPPPWSLPASSAATSQSLQQQNFCNCSKCKNGSVPGGRGGGLRVNLPAQQDDVTTARSLAEAQRQLRVMLPPEISQQATSSHDHCPCSKCQSRYGTYDDSNGNNDLMFSLDSTPALQGVLSDGLLCSVM
ncbi:hypothetical protein B7P43_G14145 [Cryptotermes secundus]|uniref:Uncharacterized protein n=2 Tax=Cryptotermes secundus TaxID=105785 RepID=A0A2J7Q2T2_9NEOP|nr:splicing factor 1 isoform X2 [Cryptotermes secundus]XP_023718072.1 splicing factor 1 isoform X2 [Cryptotermes secundus]XP_023718073.1 splicing factor 1 isoform X2 [Cryptotermes secundus]PNF22901.1 hypothetical protein B7P43_G14145 [Cryptotermes secundus]